MLPVHDRWSARQVGEGASDHLLELYRLLGDRVVQFLLDPPERYPHAIAPRCSFDKELPIGEQ